MMSNIILAQLIFAYVVPMRLVQNSLLADFLVDPTVASVCGSSSIAATIICSSANLKDSRLVLEYGPGRGAITEPMLRALPREARLIAIERNQNLVRDLIESHKFDRRLTVIPGSAVNIDSLIEIKPRTCDAIVSGIPFRMLESVHSYMLLKQTAELLKPQGVFVLYQSWIPPFITTRHLRSLLANFFYIGQREHIWANIPPLEVIVCRPKTH